MLDFHSLISPCARDISTAQLLRTVRARAERERELRAALTEGGLPYPLPPWMGDMGTTTYVQTGEGSARECVEKYVVLRWTQD